jgi:hypothetical protein
MIDPYKLTHAEGTQLFLKYIGALTVLKRTRRAADALSDELVDVIDQAMEDASTFLAGHMDIHQQKSGDWWVEPIRKDPDAVPPTHHP